MDLFGQSRGSAWERIELPGADLRWVPHWLAPDEAGQWLADLRDAIPWEVHRIRIFGREVDSPRLSCWIGDADASYTYSRTRFEPHPWTTPLSALRERIEAACATRFNSVLANLYRDGNDSMGWHSDDEAELGSQPVIASLSLGAARSFRFRSRDDRRTVRSLELPSGSLLCMAGNTQRVYQHDLPKRRGMRDARLNLTFRYIRPRS
ncbi:alpha-ketoglutarate-dependent dioxygenase AlkB [Dyella sp. GSA-30]|uniref:alpha-ketoglutarate-dependent dioxygenase AlkB family protein n=1 Tax=Dyella sp. GSA-30 TaxID=2994496 RepID=UPI002493B383|nr:alpha-ketoglutarate-dependent dioxygenase AlkB [Dyella sp. GSA-30]BDU20218.1 DNA methylase [Dyella sp. GSA-30]